MPARAHPIDLSRRLFPVAAQQAGYFTAKQALDSGYAYPAQLYHVRRGEWARADRGIYRLPEWPASQHDDLVRWTLWSRRRGVVSHETALAVHDLGDVLPAEVHLTVPANFRSRAPGVRLHRGELAPTEIEQREGFAVTMPLRSILDAAAGGTEPDQLRRVVDEALTRGLVTPGALRAAARRDLIATRVIARILAPVSDR